MIRWRPLTISQLPSGGSTSFLDKIYDNIVLQCAGQATLSKMETSNISQSVQINGERSTSGHASYLGARSARCPKLVARMVVDL